MSDYPLLEVRVWGDFACFTRPEMKVERVSYSVPTPSAARGVLEAIFWRPEIRWHVREIWLLQPIQYVSLLRNEVNSKASERSVRGWEKNGGGYAATADRAQRHTLALRDVDYLIRADIELLAHAGDVTVAKYRDQFRRRVTKGRCFTRPYLGCREFSAHFGEPSGDERPITASMELGRMLYDLDYESDGRGQPVFFEATLDHGVVAVPALAGTGGRHDAATSG